MPCNFPHRKIMRQPSSKHLIRQEFWPHGETIAGPKQDGKLLGEPTACMMKKPF
jgi:hypothetical protein